MNYLEFKNRSQNLPVIFSKDMRAGKQSAKDKQITLNQLSRWQKKGHILKLKRGIYLLNKEDRKVHPSRTFIANQLYQPSYISLEYALQFYGLIPEKVSDVTSITAKKTVTFTNGEGRFIYQRIKKEAYAGFRSYKDSAGLTFFMAQPEKALIDFIYLNAPRFKGSQPDIFEKSYRFQNLQTLKRRKLLEYTRLYRNELLTQTVKKLLAVMKSEA